MPKAEISNERFDAVVAELAEADGVATLLTIPGVWELVSEFYNNDALERIRSEDDEEDETDPHIEHDEEGFEEDDENVFDHIDTDEPD